MALVIEDGSVVTGANSYISVDGARAYAVERGITLPVDDDDVEVLLTKAMDYVESLRAEFQGMKTAKTNPCQWPRVGVEVDGFAIDTDEIPDILPKAQAQLACEASSGEDLMPNGDGREVVREKVEGAVEVQYSEQGSTVLEPVWAKARALLRPLLMSGTDGSVSLTAVRV